MVYNSVAIPVYSLCVANRVCVVCLYYGLTAIFISSFLCTGTKFSNACRWKFCLSFPCRSTYFKKLKLSTNELPDDKTNNVTVRPAKTRISLDIRPVWSESSLSDWRKLGSLATHWVHSEDSDQTGRTVILLVLSWGGSNVLCWHIWVSSWENLSSGFVTR